MGLRGIRTIVTCCSRVNIERMQHISLFPGPISAWIAEMVEFLTNQRLQKSSILFHFAMQFISSIRQLVAMSVQLDIEPNFSQRRNHLRSQKMEGSTTKQPLNIYLKGSSELKKKSEALLFAQVLLPMLDQSPHPALPFPTASAH